MINGTGSLVNALEGMSKQPEPIVGMGATRLGWTDRYPMTIVAVKGNTLTAQADDYKRIDSNGLSESQEYEYTPNPEASLSVYTLRSNGAWVRKGESMKTGERLSVGFRERYYDFSF